LTELWRLSATEAVAMLRRRELSPLELVDAAAARIEAVEPKVNALPIRFLDVARDEARRFPREGRDHPGWLAGLPMAVKDYNDVAGQLTTNGSPICSAMPSAQPPFSACRQDRSWNSAPRSRFREWRIGNARSRCKRVVRTHNSL